MHVSTLLWVLGFCWPWNVKHIFNSFLTWQVWFMGQFLHIFDDFDEVSLVELPFLSYF
jgi:hypothetical protein